MLISYKTLYKITWIVEANPQQENIFFVFLVRSIPFCNLFSQHA